MRDKERGEGQSEEGMERGKEVGKENKPSIPEMNYERAINIF